MLAISRLVKLEGKNVDFIRFFNEYFKGTIGTQNRKEHKRVLLINYFYGSIDF